ncbi:LruC domain-containing protein [Bacteroides sp.]|uniref:LruC domain-containing protein n=1 Tax=Bacteroides sp. TaxID=29523 RepID=UPI00262E83FB|nr:LruC domain-containing protein [Bacteroides sp.]
MVRNIIINRILLLAVLLGSAILSSCKNDVFNSEKVKATYQDKFPVKDIDPTMDWKMTKQVKVAVSVNEDAMTNYTIRIYDADPLSDNSTAKVLATGVASNTQSFNTVMDCPTVVNSVFVCRTDAHKRNVVKHVPIVNDQIDTMFGGTIITRSTRANDVDIKIEQYTPVNSLDKVKSMLLKAKELQSNTQFSAGSIYKISEDKEFSAPLKGDIWGSSRGTLIICGKWEPNGNNLKIPNGINIYVMNEGEIIIPQNKSLTFDQQGYLGIFPGGKISGDDNSSLALPAQSGDDKYFYNAGEIEDINFSTANNNSTTIYNCGEMNVKTIKCLHFINQGHVKCDEIGSVNGANLTIDNGCYLEAEMSNGDLNCGTGSRTEIGQFNLERAGWGTTTQIGSNALLQIEEGSFTGNVKAPSSHFALIRIKKIKDISNFKTQGKIYYEIEKAVSFDDWRQEFLEALKNGDGSYSKWGESPIIIPSGDCTGDGYKPDEDGSDVSTDPIPYTYVFEDNFPLVGDYDFNDVVLDVKISNLCEEKSNHIKQIQLDVTLTALGATKMLGAGLRIVNTPKSAIRSITPAGDYNRFHNTLTSSTFFKFNAGSYMEDGDNNIVIPLFGNAHQVFDGVQQGQMINTDPAGITSKPFTYKIIIELADQTKEEPIISKDDLDFFICYQYKNMQKRMEVHLYEFRDYGATAAGTIQQENLDLAGNNTWAICVPEFRYPKERINISNQKDNNDCAYPKFLDWARNRNTNTDWYKDPYINANNVYR